MGVKISDKVQSIFRLASFILNSLFVLFGLLLIGLGIYLFLYKADLLGIVFAMPYIRVSVIIIVFCGAVILLFAFIGLCGTCLLNRYLLIPYVLILGLLALLAIAAVVMAIVYKNTWYIDEVRQTMRNQIQKNYGVDNSTAGLFITNTWDTVQQMWYCCGVEDDSWGIYRQSQWYNNQPGDPGTKEYTAMMVPVSCCRKSQYGDYIDTQKCQNWQLGPPNVQSSNYNEAILYSGCYVVGRQILDMVAAGVIGLGISAAILLFIAVILSTALLISIRSDSPSAPAIPRARAPNFTPVAQTYPAAHVSYPAAQSGSGFVIIEPKSVSGTLRDSQISANGNYAYDNPYITSA